MAIHKRAGVLLGAVASALAISALASAGTANAEPVWDIGAYDDCMGRVPIDYPPVNRDAWAEGCCDRSGGVWKPGQGCFAPPAEAQNVPGNPNPTGPRKPTVPINPGGSVG